VTCHHGEFRKVSPTQDREIARLFAAKVPPKEIASLYGISIRQVYRSKARANRPAIEVRIAGYKAWFQVDELGPSQVTGWRAAA
jgi:DNA invertase Pin-like site-specific DNA recombinase